MKSSRLLEGDVDVLARWSAKIGGLKWIEKPADDETTPFPQLRSGDYPSIYAVPAEVVLTVDLDFVKPHYPETVASLDLSAVAAIPSGEWLVIEVWDQS